MNVLFSQRRLSHILAPRLVAWLPLVLVMLLAIGLRLVVWRWRELYPLGGDEQEYFNQALTLLQTRRYVELEFMRPPVYTLFLATSIYLFDSLVERLRLIQALISVATVPLIYWFTQEVARCALRVTRSNINATRSTRAFHDAPILAAALAAFSYTLAASATELLSETLFLFGLTLTLCLLLRAGRTNGLWWAGAAGVTLGFLALTRAVALPLLPLGALWLLWCGIETQRATRNTWHLLALPAAFGLACLLVILPWTARNYVTYGAPILIDTTGAENLWLDNDPQGRDAVKAQLIADEIYHDRAARQQLALERGVAVIRDNPAHFFNKCWNELQKLFALEHADDMRERPALWVPPAEVAARLLLGDVLWLLMLGAGVAGLWLAPPGATPDFRWVLVPWLLYIVLTSMVFHVEPRYRLPSYPALLPFAGWALAGLGVRGQGLKVKGWGLEVKGWGLEVRGIIAITTLAFIGGVMLAHRPYLGEGWMLARKHFDLWQAERALAAGDTLGAERSATRALALDDTSALARVALGRTALLTNNEAATERWARAAIDALPAHPYGHLLLGELLRRHNQRDAARAAFGYETASRQDLQAWALNQLHAPPVTRVEIGDLDLGYIQGFHGCIAANCPSQRAPEPYRWTTDEAEVVLTRPAAGLLRLRLAAPRPVAAPAPLVEVLLDGRPLATLQPSSDWQNTEVALPAGSAGPTHLTLRTNTYRPRDYDRSSPDGRSLGVQLDWVEVVVQ